MEEEILGCTYSHGHTGSSAGGDDAADTAGGWSGGVSKVWWGDQSVHFAQVKNGHPVNSNHCAVT